MTSESNGYRAYKGYWDMIAKCTRLFFTTIEPDQLQALMAANNQVGLVESLYARGTISSIVRYVAKRWTPGMKHFSELSNDIDDCIQGTTWALLVVAKRNKMKLDRTPGEVATYVCQWIEQKVKRLMTAEFRHQLFLDKETRNIEDYQASPSLSFDDVLIARQTIRRHYANHADIVSSSGRVNGAGEETERDLPGVTKKPKALRVDKLRSRSHQVRSNNANLGRLFGITGIAKSTQETISSPAGGNG